MDEGKRRHGVRRERVKASRQYARGRFHNPSGAVPGLESGALPLLGELVFGGQEREPRRPLPVERPHEGWRGPVGSGLRTTWLGHSTMLLEIDGHRLLTDPVFAHRASPVPFAGPKRFHRPPARIEELPPLDVVLVSHDHYDHLCSDSIGKLARTEAMFVTALGVGARLEAFGVEPRRIVELDWHESVDVRGLRLIATPAQHFSGRTAVDRNATLWASWVIESHRHKLFFSGDTGLTDAFVSIGHTHGPFDLVMLEIGAFHPSWGSIHLGPENALEAFRMLRGRTLLPVHWSTFNLALHAWFEPGETLFELAARQGARILTPRLGAVLEPDRIDAPTPWWREHVREVLAPSSPRVTPRPSP